MPKSDGAGGITWAPESGGGGGGASVLDDLLDVDTSGVEDGDVLAFDAGAAVWAPAGSTGGSDPTRVPKLADVRAYNAHASLDEAADLAAYAPSAAPAGSVAGSACACPAPRSASPNP